MTPFGASVARELRPALVPIDTASIVACRLFVADDTGDRLCDAARRELP